MQHSPIFPSESQVSEKDSASAWRMYSSISPTTKNYEDLDVWGKICKADCIKYKNEQQEKYRQKVLQQTAYRQILDKQIEETRKSLESKWANSPALKNKQKSYSKFISPKRLKTPQRLEVVKQTEVEKERCQGNPDYERSRIRDFSVDSASEANRKHKKYSYVERTFSQKPKDSPLRRVKMIDLLGKGRDHLYCKSYSKSNEDVKLKPIKKRDPKSFADVNLNSLKFNDNAYGAREKVKEYYRELERQIQEKQENLIFKAKMVKVENIEMKEFMKQVANEDKKKKMEEKERKERLRLELSNQVTQKVQSRLAELLFTDTEAKINKKIFESSLTILENSKNY